MYPKFISSRAEGTVRLALDHGFGMATPVVPVIFGVERNSIMRLGVAEHQDLPQERNGRGVVGVGQLLLTRMRHVFTTALIRHLPRPSLASPVII